MELQIIRAREFIRLGAHGEFDLKASKAVLAALAGACWKRGINQALLDLRALHPGPKPIFSANDLVTLVNTFREIGFKQRQRLAVLYRSDPHHRAPMFTFIAKQRGWNVQAFKSFEAALLWLSGAGPEASETETEYTPAAKEVAVRTLKSLEASSKLASPPAVPIKSRAGSRRAAAPAKAAKKPAPSARGSMTALAIGLLTALAGQV